jgi:type I restriction enzyme S subunit
VKLKDFLLEDILDLITDYHANGSYEILKQNVELKDSYDYAVMIRTTNFENDDFRENLKYINQKSYDFLNKSKVFAGDILMNKIASAGSVYHMPDLKRPVSLAMNLFLIRINSKKANNKYIYEYLKLNEAYIKQFAIGTATTTITKKSVRNLKLSLPPLEIQNKIAAILSAYDDLIENNKRRIALLENMAEELYREWFVRFRFPGWREAEFEKGIPKGWEIKPILSLVDRHKFGKIYKEIELLPEGKVMVIDQSRNNYLGFYNGKAEHKASHTEPMILFGDHTCKMVLMLHDFSLAENVIPFKSKESIPVHFLFHLVKDKAKTTEYKRHWTELVNQKVLLPLNFLQEDFSGLVSDNYKEIEALKLANYSLSKIKNSLLPRLISGKLSVENLDIHFPSSMQAKYEAA